MEKAFRVMIFWLGGVCLGFALALLPSFVPAGEAQAKEPVKQGQTLPDLELPTPGEESQAAYLGLQPSQGNTFRLSQIKQPWVLIEVFNMYCTICQGEAKKVNQLYGEISKGPLKEQLAVIGIGAGNSPFEVKVFRNRYQIEFPLLSDGSYKQHQALGEPRTPYFLLVKLSKPNLSIALHNLGAFGEVSDFLSEIEKIMKQN